MYDINTAIHVPPRRQPKPHVYDNCNNLMCVSDRARFTLGNSMRGGRGLGCEVGGEVRSRKLRGERECGGSGGYN